MKKIARINKYLLYVLIDRIKCDTFFLEKFVSIINHGYLFI